jgi:hypothetical protein
MIKEVYHPKFSDDIVVLSKILEKKHFYQCLLQIDRAIEQVLRNPYKPPTLKYSPLEEYRKKKFFSKLRPRPKQRSDMRILYRYEKQEKTIYFLSVGLRIVSKPRNPNDIYQRSIRRNVKQWHEKIEYPL